MAHITRPVTDPFQYLEEDHQKVAALLEKACETTEAAEKTRTSLFAEIRDGLRLHTEIEEKFVYPAQEKMDDTRALALEAEEEHKVVKTLLDEMDGLEPDNEEWTAKLTVLKENVEHHVKEEESELFPKSKKELSDEQQQEIAENIESFLTEHGM